MHTSYTDALRMSYIERQYILSFIKDKQDATQKEISRVEAERRSRRTQ